VTPQQQQLHWLRVSDRIMYKLRSLAHLRLHGLDPDHLAYELQRVSDAESRRRLRSASTVTLVVPTKKHSVLGDVPSLSPQPVPGIYRAISCDVSVDSDVPVRRIEETSV
jgi:hypothetical protein